MVSACTIVARNYLSHARILATSFFAHHPDGAFTTLIIDDEERTVDCAGEPFQCVRLCDIGLPSDEIGRLVALYDVTELATAVKPPLLRHLLASGADVMIYLDPDIKVYGSLEPIAGLARQHGIVVTPHMLGPMPRDGRRVDEFHILAAGVYNLGFIAVGQGARFLEWWWDRTRREARIDPTRMMFTDQRWIDFAPALFDHHILKDPTCNVAYWNLHERDVVWDGERYLVNGQPLTFFHFSGFDAKRPYLLSKHQGQRPRILLSERAGVARICAEYLGDLERAGVSRASALKYGWQTLPSGLPFDRQMRRLYRDGLDAAVEGVSAEPPCPFDPGMEAEFLAWLNEPVAGGLRKTVSRYLHAIYQDRPDLQRAFPDLADAGVEPFFDWIRGDGVVQHNIPPGLIPPVLESAAGDSALAYVPAARVTPGVNIAGYFRAELGVGEAARLLTCAVEASGLPHATLTYDVTPSRKAHPFRERGDGRAPHDVNVLCLNADQTAAFAAQAGPRFFEGRYTIGYWFWELDRFPPSMHHAFDYVDEVWTATRFVASGIRAIGRRPVTTVPLPVPVPACSPDVTRQTLGLPSNFLFLFVFDFFSILERKNPIGLIAAFTRAFKPDEGPVLMIKTINGSRNLTELEQVRAAAAGRRDILVVDDYYSAEQKNSLIGLCDCYVSLHRSEGLGLTMAEAMALGKPTIATGYSGNTDFMTAENSYLVDYTLTGVPAGCDPYPRDSRWAEPNLDHAAEFMRRVYVDRDDANARGRRARTDILTKHNAAASAAVLRERLAAIRENRRHSGPRPAPAGAGAGAAMPSPSAALRDQVAAGLDRAESLLTPSSSVARGRLLARPMLLLQKVLFRAMRPYWWQQRQLQQALIQTVREIGRQAARSADAEPHQREALESVWRKIQSLEAVPTTQSLAELQDGLSTFQTAAATHLAALTEGLADTTSRVASLTTQLAAEPPCTAAEVSELVERLYAVPHMNVPDRFSLTENGRQVMGFRGGRRTTGDLYRGFEDIFRGSESFIRDRLAFYLPVLRAHARVVDIGCGRGELLDLLRDAGVSAIGVDLDEGMVRRCRSRGHHVEEMDGLAYLRQQPDDSWPAIFAAQVVEHLTYDDFLSFLRLAHTKLGPDGQLIFETVNPHALEAFKTFHTDLTHQRPIFPEVALAWCWLTGFDEAVVVFPTGEDNLERDRRTRGEYAVVATKRA
jgi:glycosyltransferase involved in cell wall biosynthesis/2-polyprenyl-3-methyl-5-hydroxy-6-metoxy-1,4-benzoquinol methylase